LTSASYAGLSCSGVIDCLQAAASGGWQWQMLDPWREPAFDAGTIPVNGGAALTQLVHRIGALLVSLVLLALAVLALRGVRRREGLALLLLLALQLVVAVLMVASGLALPLALAHNVIAALMLAVVLRMI
jgi:cytochrome c oxidase assembly protein subunit 15